MNGLCAEVWTSTFPARSTRATETCGSIGTCCTCGTRKTFSTTFQDDFSAEA